MNYITKPYRVIIIEYAECVRDMFELAQYISHTNNKGELLHKEKWTAQDKLFMEETIHKDIKDGIPT